MKYDDASWHYGGNFPDGLPESAGATHIGMFLSWAALNGLISGLHVEELSDDLGKLKNRTVTPVAWFVSVCDEKFTDEDLNDEGNNFAKAYYADEKGPHTVEGSFLYDFAQAFPNSETLYNVPDTWATYEALAPIIQSRYEAWRKVR